MGLALVECRSGCACRASLADGYWSYKASLTQMHKFRVGGWVGGWVWGVCWGGVSG
jgi:hypothetical protein